MLRRILYRNFLMLYRGSRWLRLRFTPLGQLILGTMMASGLFGVNTRQTLAYQVFALTASLILLAVAGSIRFRAPLRTARDLPRYGTVDAPLAYRVLVHNAGPAAQQDLWLMDELDASLPSFSDFASAVDPDDAGRNWFDRAVGYPRLMGLIQKRRGADSVPVAVPPVPPRGQASVEIRIRPRRRGYLRFAGTRLMRLDPFGLLRAQRLHPDPAALLVLPRLYRVPALRLGGRRRYQRGGMTLASSVGDSQEFISLRDYKPGDPLRAIHWKSFAKLGTPVVKEFHDEFFVRQALVLDTFIEDRPEAHFEEAVSVAASFALDVPDQDALLDLMFIGTEAFRVTAGRGLGRPENLVEILACAAPCRDKPFSALADLIARHLHETSALIGVFLGWDHRRREFVQSLATAGVTVAAFVVTADARPVRAEPAPSHLVAVPPGRIQEALDRTFPGPVRAA